MKRIFDIPAKDRPDTVPAGSKHYDITLGTWENTYLVGQELEDALDDLKYPGDPTGEKGLMVPTGGA